VFNTFLFFVTSVGYSLRATSCHCRASFGELARFARSVQVRLAALRVKGIVTCKVFNTFLFLLPQSAIPYAPLRGTVGPPSVSSRALRARFKSDLQTKDERENAKKLSSLVFRLYLASRALTSL
jgi:hypothetical protein